MRLGLPVTLGIAVAAAVGCSSGHRGASYNGGLFLAFDRDATQGARFVVSGAFFRPGLPSGLVEPTLPAIGSCRREPSIPLPGDYTQLDAGSQLTVAGPLGTLPVPSDGAHSYFVLTTADVFSPATGYSISGPGGIDVGPFTTSIQAPADIDVIAPAMTSPVTITRSAGISLQWTTSDGSPVIIDVFQVNASSGSFVEVVCEFEDSGAATVPSSVLGDLSADSSGANTTLTIERASEATFRIDQLGEGQLFFVADRATNAAVQ